MRCITSSKCPSAKDTPYSPCVKRGLTAESYEEAPLAPMWERPFPEIGIQDTRLQE